MGNPWMNGMVRKVFVSTGLDWVTIPKINIEWLGHNQ